jgi:ABC-type multidrug transport system permease subunit
MQEVEVTFGRAAQVWWAWLWRALVFTVLFSFLSGFILGFAGHFAGFTSQQLIPISMIFGVTAGVVISIWMMSKILKKNFGSFRIALIQN